MHPISNILRERGWSGQTLARSAGFSNQLVSQVLRGQVRPSARFMAACAAALNMPEDSLFRFETVRRPACAGGGGDG